MPTATLFLLPSDYDSDKVEPLEFMDFFVKGARLPWAHATRLQQLHRLLLTTNVSNKSGNLLFAQK
jgi:hypothetical protein